MLTPATPEVDSRHYIIAYAIRSLEDAPADFPIPEGDAGFRLGLFLPRDRPDWFGRSSYPARILLLSGGMLVILAHPKTREPVVRIPLQELLFLETGHILLLGWLSFVEKCSEYKLPYNTRCAPPVEEFLRVLRDEYLPATLETSQCGPLLFGGPLDLKVRNAVHAELDTGERLLFQFFCPATKRIRNYWLFRRKSWVSGHLVALTNRRALWITERFQERHEFYGTVAVYAPIRTLLQLRCQPTGQDCGLLIKLSSGASWCISLPLEMHADAHRFAEEVTRFCQRREGPD